MDIDQAYSEFLQVEAALNAALKECENEQAAGRTGIDPYRRAEALSEKLTTLAQVLSAGIERELSTL